MWKHIICCNNLPNILILVNEKDRFSVVTYDTNVYIDFGLQVMTADNKKDALHEIKNIQSGSCTNLCGGLLKGLCQIIDRPADQKNEVASVLLFTDGLANNGNNFYNNRYCMPICWMSKFIHIR